MHLNVWHVWKQAIMLSGFKMKYFYLYHRIRTRDDEHLMQQADRRQKNTDQISRTLIPSSLPPPSSASIRQLLRHLACYYPWRHTHRISYFFNEIPLSSCILLQFFLILERRQRALRNFRFKIPLYRIQTFEWMKTQVTYWHSQCPGYSNTFGYVNVNLQMYGTKSVNLTIGYVVGMIMVIWAHEFIPNDTSLVSAVTTFSWVACLLVF
jgi:hypothetical protein